MWKVTFVNATKTTYTVSLHGRATDAVEGLIVDGTSTTFALPPGTKIINAADGQEVGFDCVQASVENLTRIELLEPVQEEFESCR